VIRNVQQGPPAAADQRRQSNWLNLRMMGCGNAHEVDD
jgi:hypothetical protein